ncbi:MAG: hypothetical protein OXI92_01540 [Acidobacteriota bacterium]|nr:hypothetical protein [Acidobacteriota bacterium]
MRPTLHIVSKDFRDLRLLLPLFGWWGLSILQVVLISVFGRIPGSPPAIEMMSGVFLGGLAWLLAALDFGLLVLIVSQLIQRDSTVGSTAFWLSRPVSGARLLAGKSLFLLLAVILPTVAAQFLTLLFNGVTLYDAFRSVPQIVVLQLLVLGLLTTLACLTPNLPRMLFAGIVAAVGLAIVQYALRLPLLRTGWNRSLEDSAAIGFSLFLLAIALTVACHQYLTRQTRRSLILASPVLPALFLFTILWPWDFWPTEAPVAQAILDPEEVAARVEVGSLRLYRQVNRQGDDWLILRGDLAADSLPAGMSAIPADISAEQISSSGKGLARHRGRSPHLYTHLSPRYRSYFEEHLDEQRGELLAGLLGGVKFLNLNAPSWQLPLELLAIRGEHYDRHAGASTVYEAQVEFVVQQNRMNTMRLESGFGYERGSDHGRILAVTNPIYRPTDQGFSILLSESEHRLTLDTGMTVRYLLVHPSRREALLGRRNFFLPTELASPHPWSGILSMLRVGRRSFDFLLPEGSPPLPENWLEGAELVRVETTHRGVFSKTIRLEDFVLERIPLSPGGSGSAPRQETVGAGEWGIGW